MARNPVMFVVEIGAAMTTYAFIASIAGSASDTSFVGQIALWLWFTVLFANFAEAIAEGRGKAQAQALRRTRTETIARKLTGGLGGTETAVPAIDLRKGDVVVCEAGDVIPSDGTIIEGIASVDESAITGESAPVIREAGGDRSAVTGGTRVLSDRVVIEITQNPGETFLDRMISLVESASRQKTPNEIALNILLASLTLIFLIAVVTLQPFAIYSGASISVPVLIALLVCLIPTTIGGLPCQGGPSKPLVTWTRCSSTRRARSPSATARRPSSCRRPGSPWSSWCGQRTLRAAPTRPRRGVRSCPWRVASAPPKTLVARTGRSCHSRRKHG
jgi:potassium-transporting ATPase ATP-binding subunit